MNMLESLKTKPVTPVELCRGDKGYATKTGRFVLRDGYLYFEDVVGAGREPSKPVKICGELKIIARTRNNNAGAHGRLLEFKDDDGKRKLIAIPCSELQSDGLDIRKRLSDMGLFIRPNNKARALLNEYILESSPSQAALCVSRTGWHSGAYILPDRIVGPTGGERLVYQPESGDYASDITQAGTLEQWQKIPKLCAGNSRLVFSLSCSFAGPLLRLLNEPGGGFNLFGSSSDGKSTALYVASSVYGDPESYHRKWNSTHVGLEYLAFSRNDGLLALDELGEGDGKNAGKAAYTLADGVGRSRGKAGGGMRATPTWKVITLSTGETTLEQHIMESGTKVRAGQQVRMVDIPADTNSGYKAFEQLHGYEYDENNHQLPNDKAGGLFADTLNDLAKRYYGTSLITYLEYISKQYAGDANIFHLQHADYTRRFLETYVPEESSPQVRRVAKRFALMGFAGELATEAGVTMWDHEESTKAAAKCFQAWIEQRGGTGAQEEKAAIAQVKYYFERYSESRFIRAGDDNHRPHDMAGYIRNEGSDVQFLVTPEVFKRDICEGLNASKVAGYCKDAGLLVPDKAGKNSTSVHLDGKQKRVYVFNESAM
jgi:putative DNA primase/helicase